MDLSKANSDDSEVVKGQIVISLMSRDGPHSSRDITQDNTVSVSHAVSPQATQLPDGWEERRTSHGRLFYVNHHTKTTQWTAPNRLVIL